MILTGKGGGSGIGSVYACIGNFLNSSGLALGAILSGIGKGVSSSNAEDLSAAKVAPHKKVSAAKVQHMKSIAVFVILIAISLCPYYKRIFSTLFMQRIYNSIIDDSRKIAAIIFSIILSISHQQFHDSISWYKIFCGERNIEETNGGVTYNY